MAARETALNVLIAVRKEAAWSNGILKVYIQRDKLNPKDAALATRLCYGVIQNRALLDAYLKQLLTGKLKDLHPVVRDILHLGLYQIYQMDKIPDSAAVNESVQLAKKYCNFPKPLALLMRFYATLCVLLASWRRPKVMRKSIVIPRSSSIFLKNMWALPTSRRCWKRTMQSHR